MMGQEELWFSVSWDDVVHKWSCVYYKYYKQICQNLESLILVLNQNKWILKCKILESLMLFVMET